MQLPNRLLTVSICALIPLAAACASKGGAGGAERSCALRREDSVFVTTGPVYRDCAVERRARLATRVPRMDWTPSSPGCYSAIVEFVVDTEGSPEMQTARIVRSTDPSFGQSVVALVPQLKYEPAQRGGIRVRQIVSFEQKAAMTVVVVPAGGARPPASQRAPSC